MAFLYSLFLKLLYPTSLALILMATALVARTVHWRRRALISAILLIMVCGNGCLTGALTRRLERRHLPAQPLPSADAILVLSGGVLAGSPPRPSVEIADAGDRIIYGAQLFRQQKAPQIICTGNVATGGISVRPAADDMASLLELLGVPSSAIVRELRSENTHDHAVNLCPILAERKIASALLVTSALHMPRAIATFRRSCPTVVVHPAPTDFRVIDDVPPAWYRRIANLIPTPRTLLDFSDVMHEYLGIAYYRWRGWL